MIYEIHLRLRLLWNFTISQFLSNLQMYLISIETLDEFDKIYVFVNLYSIKNHLWLDTVVRMKIENLDWNFTPGFN